MYSYYLLPFPNIYLNTFFKRQFQPSEMNCCLKWVRQAMNAALLGQKIIQNVLVLKYILQGSCVSFEGANSEGPSQLRFLSWAKLTCDVWEPSALTPAG